MHLNIIQNCVKYSAVQAHIVTIPIKSPLNLKIINFDPIPIYSIIKFSVENCRCKNGCNNPEC